VISLLVGAAAYGLTGYLVFLKWIRMSPPQEGKFEWNGHPGAAAQGWYVPAIIKSPQIYSERRGLPLERVMWVAITGWPIVFIVSGCLVAGIQLKRLSIFLTQRGQTLSRQLARTTLPSEKKEEPPKSPELIAAEKEVETFLAPEDE